MYVFYDILKQKRSIKMDSNTMTNNLTFAFQNPITPMLLAIMPV